MRRHRKQRPTTLPTGTISEATLRPEDLIPAYLDALEGLRLSKAERATVRHCRHDWDTLDSETTADYDEQIGYVLDELTMVLESHVPDYCYFGSTDGACFGVWPSREVFEDYSQGGYDGCIYRCTEAFQMPRDVKPSILKPYSHFLSVTDHGNVTLYRRSGNRWIEVWSVV